MKDQPARSLHEIRLPGKGGFSFSLVLDHNDRLIHADGFAAEQARVQG